jgi:hypothetical protein
MRRTGGVAERQEAALQAEPWTGGSVYSGSAKVAVVEAEGLWDEAA